MYNSIKDTIQKNTIFKWTNISHVLSIIADKPMNKNVYIILQLQIYVYLLAVTKYTSKN